jgi:integrase
MRDHSWEESIAEIERVSAAYPDGVHTVDELEVLEPGRRPLLNPGSSYVNRDEEIRRMAEAYEERKHAVFLTKAQIKRLITALVNDHEGAHPEDHDLYIALLSIYERTAA